MQTLQQAAALHQQGDLIRAELLYSAVLRERPDDPAALNLLGVLKLQSARGAEAAELIGRAVAVQPDYAEAHNNLGLAQRHLGAVSRGANE